MENWNYLDALELAPVGTPVVLADGQVVLSGKVVNRGAAQVSLRTSFANGTLFYSLDGSDPVSNPTLYTGAVAVASSALLRAVAFNSSFSASAEMDPVQIAIYPVLTVSTVEGGTVTIDPPDGAYFSNGVAQITAQPGPGCTFLQWLGDASGTNPVTTVTMNGSKSVEAVFGTAVEIHVVGAGSVVADPSVLLYPFGTTVRFTALPGVGSYLAFWGGLGTNNPLHFSVSTTNPSVTAVFLTLGENESALTVVENGQGHVVKNYENYYANGQSVTLTAVPDAGQSFLGWSGSAVGSQPSLTVTVNSNEVFTANFSERPQLEVGTLLEGMAEGSFRLTLMGEFGAQYEILSSVDLLNWTLAGTLTNTYGTCQFTDLTATNFPRQFYRAVGLP